MSDIFISHIHEDEIAARGLFTYLSAKLKGSNVRVFYSSDPSQLRLGDDWLRKIRDALKAAKIVLALFSPESVQRPWVNFEAGGAWFSDDKILIPLCIGELNPAQLPKPYSNIQGAHLEALGTGGYLLQRIWDEFKLPEPVPVPNLLSSSPNETALRNAMSTWLLMRDLEPRLDPDAQATSDS